MEEKRRRCRLLVHGERYFRSACSLPRSRRLRLPDWRRETELRPGIRLGKLLSRPAVPRFVCKLRSPARGEPCLQQGSRSDLDRERAAAHGIWTPPATGKIRPYSGITFPA